MGFYSQIFFFFFYGLGKGKQGEQLGGDLGVCQRQSLSGERNTQRGINMRHVPITCS